MIWSIASSMLRRARRRRRGLCHALPGAHSAIIREGLDVVRRRFASDQATAGDRKDEPVSVAKFERGEGPAPELREARVLRQRQASDLIDRLLAGIG